MVVDVEEEANPPTMIPIGVTIIMGGWVKMRASKKHTAPQETTEEFEEADFTTKVRPQS